MVQMGHFSYYLVFSKDYKYQVWNSYLNYLGQVKARCLFQSLIEFIYNIYVSVSKWISDLSIRETKKRPKVCPLSVCPCLFLCCGLGREHVSLIGTVFILFNHFNTQLMLLVYLILYGKLSFNDSHLVINHEYHCYLLKC